MSEKELLPVQGEDPIPEWIANIAFEGYVQTFGECQTFERLHQRGGFGKEELLMFICCQRLGMKFSEVQKKWQK